MSYVKTICDLPVEVMKVIWDFSELNLSLIIENSLVLLGNMIPLNIVVLHLV